jgi:multiple antibiotic resistance protein
MLAASGRPKPMFIDSIQHILSTALLAVAALFPIVDPLGGMAIYLSMIGPLDAEERARMAMLVAINSFFLLVASILIGSYVLDFFGISIPAVQIGGGFVVCTIGWSLLKSPAVPAMSDRPSAADIDVVRQRAFFPLTLPLTVGPGTISVAVTLGADPAGNLRTIFTTTLAHVLGVFVIAVSIYVCYRYADRILRRLGSAGTNVLMRLTSFILLCIGVQIMWNGIRTLLIGVQASVHT